MSVREEFEKALHDRTSALLSKPTTELSAKDFSDITIATWAAKWMADRIKQESHICLEDGNPCGHINIEIVRQLSQDLGEAK